jgi:hypothetical protein
MNINTPMTTFLLLMMIGCTKSENIFSQIDVEAAFGMGMLYEQAIDTPDPLRCALIGQADAFALAYRASHFDVPEIVAKNARIKAAKEKCK